MRSAPHPISYMSIRKSYTLTFHTFFSFLKILSFVQSLIWPWHAGNYVWHKKAIFSYSVAAALVWEHNQVSNGVWSPSRSHAEQYSEDV